METLRATPKVGDRVETLKAHLSYYDKGERGTVVGFYGDLVNIRFDDYNPSREAWRGEAGHTYWSFKVGFYDDGKIKKLPRKKKNNLLV